MNISAVGMSFNPYGLSGGGSSIGDALQVALFSELLDKAYHRAHDEADNNTYNSITYNNININVTYGCDGKMQGQQNSNPYGNGQGVGSIINTQV